MRKLLLIIAFACTAIGQTPICPGAYLPVGTGCYTFPQISSTWTAASTFCQVSGGYLVNIDSAAEQSALLSYYNTNLNDYNIRWIGITDMISNGTWRWVPSGKIAVYRNWETSEPVLSPTDNCAHWYPGRNLWFTDPCCTAFANSNPLCETDPL